MRKQVYIDAHTHTLLEDGLEKVVAGETTLEEVLKLIELDNDDPREETDLNDALNATKISQAASGYTSANTAPTFTMPTVEEKPEPKVEEVKVEEPKPEPVEEVKVEEPKVEEDIEFEEPKIDKIEVEEPSNVEEEEEDEDLMNMEF